jgi:uncharacterized LabA/DUF88 family protein
MPHLGHLVYTKELKKLEPLKTVIFIDGNNFNRNLRAFRFYSRDRTSQYHLYPFRLDEKHFDWKLFFGDVLKKYQTDTQYDYRLIRVYWYYAASIRPFEPFSNTVDHALDYCQRVFPWFTREELLRLAREWYKIEEGRFNIARNRVYRDIQTEYSFIEFKYVGEYVVKPFEVHKIDYEVDVDGDGRFIYQGVEEGEKGVDVGITVDMIAKMNNYDVAILLSGDADFIPASCYIKDNLKYVYQFSLRQGKPPNVTYLSRFLKAVIDAYQYYDELELLKLYLKRYTIPPDVLASIDSRIAQLSI